MIVFEKLCVCMFKQLFGIGIRFGYLPFYFSKFLNEVIQTDHLMCKGIAESMNEDCLSHNLAITCLQEMCYSGEEN